MSYWRGWMNRRRVLRLIGWAVLCVLLYGVLVAPRRVEITHHEVTLPGLPAAMDGTLLVQVTDIHAGPLFRAGSVRRIVRTVNLLHPDIVVLTGDFVNYKSLEYMPECARELGALKARFGTFACLGNHDHWENAAKVQSALESSGIRVLMNENVRVGDGLHIAGIDDSMSGQPDLQRAVKGISPDAATVLLSHNPIILASAHGRPWLVLAGHTHGGQIALPWLGPRGTIGLPGIRSLVRFYEGIGVRAHHGRLGTVSTYLYPAGWYGNGKTRMYANRGVGFSLATPIRLNCPPEIACVTLRAERRANPTGRTNSP